MFVGLVNSEGNVAQEGAVSPQDDGENDLFTPLELTLMGAYPLLGHPIFVGMGNQERCGGDVPICHHTVDIRSVGQGEWP